MNATDTTTKRPSLWIVALVLVYTAVVLTVDTLAVSRSRLLIDWTLFRWNWGHGFDGFKFVCWFLIPFAYALRGLDWGAFTFRGWKRVDWVLIALVLAVGAAAFVVIPMVPSLRADYGTGSRVPSSDRFEYAMIQLLWTASWLPGWEFLHRYVLTRTVTARWASYGWLIVPLFEGLYHIQKSWPETALMVVFSVIATRWAIKRSNVLLPFLAHLIVEVAVILYLVL